MHAHPRAQGSAGQHQDAFAHQTQPLGHVDMHAGQIAAQPALQQDGQGGLSHASNLAERERALTAQTEQLQLVSQHQALAVVCHTNLML